jgi:hypothetical protein
MDWSTFTLTDNKGIIIAAPCVDVVAFSSQPATAASGKGFERFVRTFAKRYGSRLTFSRTGDMKRFRPVEKQSLDAPSHWFSDTKLLATKMLAFVAHSGEVERSAMPAGLKLMLWGFDKPPCFVFRMTLPVDAAQNPEDVVAFAQDALREFPLDHGYCGYSLVWDETSADAEAIRWAGPLYLRHPGLNYESAVALSNAASDGVVAVSWLTFLGPQITAALGGPKKLAKAIPSGVSMLPLGEGGTLLRAGERPELGDVNRRERLPLYRAVGRLVSPHRASDEELEDLLVEGMSEEASVEWLHRFFG